MVFLSCMVDPVLTRGQTEQNLSNRIHPPALTVDIELCVCVCVCEKRRVRWARVIWEGLPLPYNQLWHYDLHDPCRPHLQEQHSYANRPMASVCLRRSQPIKVHNTGRSTGSWRSFFAGSQVSQVLTRWKYRYVQDCCTHRRREREIVEIMGVKKQQKIKWAGRTGKHNKAAESENQEEKEKGETEIEVERNRETI